MNIMVQAATANTPVRIEPTLTILFFGLRLSPSIIDDAAIKEMTDRYTKTAHGTPRGKLPVNAHNITNSNPVENRDIHKALDNVDLSIYKSLTTLTYKAEIVRFIV